MNLHHVIGRHWLALALIAAGAAHAAVIYKWKDSEGVIHYSDQAVPGAEKIATSSNASNGVGGATRAAAAPAPPRASSSAPYAEFVIDSPGKEQVFFGDDSIPVRARLAPALKETQMLTWRLNGSPLAEHAGALQFTLAAMPRGTYQLSATVIDSATGDSQSAEAVTFYVRQPSELAPLHKRP